MSKSGQHVIPHSGNWAVMKAGASRVTSVHDTQKAAIEAGSRIARNQSTELYVHGKDGRIRDRHSYGNDPFPPKG
jgi:hypothetical protein